MKKILFSLLTLAITHTAAAKNLACELPYDLSEEDGVEVVRTVGISEKTKLSMLQKKQIVETSNRWLVEMDYDSDYTNFNERIHVLKADSEGGELNYVVFRFQDEMFTQIILYPGGNAYGVIFQGEKVVAEQHDGDISCE